MRPQPFGALLGSAILVSLALACERGDSPAGPAASSASAASRINTSSAHSGLSADAERDERTGCTLASLTGAYGVQRMGYTTQGRLTAVGITTFDGQGNSLATERISRNGVVNVTQSPSAYTVNPDCSGTLTVNGAIVAHLLIVHQGTGVLGMSLTPGDNVSSHYEKVVDRSDDAGCTNASLTGTYGFQRMGQNPQGPVTALGIGTFDGQGSDVASQTTSRSGVFSDQQPFVSFYTVNPDCTGTAILNGSAFAYFVIVHGGSEVLGVALNQGLNVAVHYDRLVDRPGQGPEGAR
jgi:hypothetical protein